MYRPRWPVERQGIRSPDVTTTSAGAKLRALKGSRRIGCSKSLKDQGQDQFESGHLK